MPDTTFGADQVHLVTSIAAMMLALVTCLAIFERQIRIGIDLLELIYVQHTGLPEKDYRLLPLLLGKISSMIAFLGASTWLLQLQH